MSLLDPYIPMAPRPAAMPDPVADLLAAMAREGVRLPVAPDPLDPATLVDVAGAEVLTVDATGSRSDETAAAIAAMVAAIINRAAGLAPSDAEADAIRYGVG